MKDNNIVVLPIIVNLFLITIVGIALFLFKLEVVEEVKLENSNYDIYLDEVALNKYMLPKTDELGRYNNLSFYLKTFKSGKSRTRLAYSIMCEYDNEEYLNQKDSIYSSDSFRFLKDNTIPNYHFYFPFYEFKMNNFVFTIHLDYKAISKYKNEKTIDYSKYECGPPNSFGMVGYNDEEKQIMYFYYKTEYSDDFYYFSNFFQSKSPLNCYIQWEKFVKNNISFEFFEGDLL